MKDSEFFSTGNIEQVIDCVDTLGKLLDGIKEKDILRRTAKHLSLVRGELEDLNIIWRRFLENRKELLSIDPLTSRILKDKVPQNNKTRKLFRQEALLLKSLKVDLKSIFLFGDILFNKVALLIRSILEPHRSIKYESFSGFLKSIRKIEDRKSPEYRMYNAIGEDFEKLEVVLGFYRDKFIVHVSGPYQEGTSRTIYLPEFRLNHTSWKLDEFDFTKFNNLVNKLRLILPLKDKYGNPLDKPCDPRLKIDVLFKNLHKIKDPSLKQKAEGYIRSVGMSSPDIYYVVSIIKEVSEKLTDFLCEEIKAKYQIMND